MRNVLFWRNISNRISRIIGCPACLWLDEKEKTRSTDVEASVEVSSKAKDKQTINSLRLSYDFDCVPHAFHLLLKHFHSLSTKLKRINIQSFFLPTKFGILSGGL